MALLNEPEESEDYFLDPRSSLGFNCRVWGGSHIREFVEIGSHTTIGRNVYIGPSVRIGKNCKIQNNALIYEPSTLEDNIFIGPGVIFTNDKLPRAVNLDHTPKTSTDWKAEGVHVHEGASVGAGVICIAPIELGRWSMIGAGSVVTKSVPDFALVVGSPARRVGWVGRSGYKLIEESDSHFKCPISQEEYALVSEDKLVLINEHLSESLH